MHLIVIYSQCGFLAACGFTQLKKKKDQYWEKVRKIIQNRKQGAETRFIFNRIIPNVLKNV